MTPGSRRCSYPVGRRRSNGDTCSLRVGVMTTPLGPPRTRRAQRCRRRSSRRAQRRGGGGVVGRRDHSTALWVLSLNGGLEVAGLGVDIALVVTPMQGRGGLRDRQIPVEVGRQSKGPAPPWRPKLSGLPG